MFQLSRWGFGIYGYWQIFAKRFEVFASVEDYCIVLIHCYISGWSIGLSRNGILRLQFIFGFFFVVVQVCCENWWCVYTLCVVCVSCVLYSTFCSDWWSACFIVGLFLKVIHPHCIYNTKDKGKAIPLQAWTGPKGSRSLRLQDFKKTGTWRWQGCQPYAPATFTPRKYSWYSFLLDAESTAGSYCGWKEYVNEKFHWYHQESNPRHSDL